jgi:hypothetical protein
MWKDGQVAAHGIIDDHGGPTSGISFIIDRKGLQDAALVIENSINAMRNRGSIVERQLRRLGSMLEVSHPRSRCSLGKRRKCTAGRIYKK